MTAILLLFLSLLAIGFFGTIYIVKKLYEWKYRK